MAMRSQVQWQRTACASTSSGSCQTSLGGLNRFPLQVGKLFVFQVLSIDLDYWTSRPMGPNYCWEIKNKLEPGTNQTAARISSGSSRRREALLGVWALR